MSCIICGETEGPLYSGAIKDMIVTLCRKHKFTCHNCTKVDCRNCTVFLESNKK